MPLPRFGRSFVLGGRSVGRPARRAAAFGLTLLLCLGSAFAQAPTPASAPTATRPTSRPTPPLSGALTIEQGVRVLRLAGTPYEAGYAHGYLLAEEIVPFVDQFVVSLPFVVGVERYRSRVLPFVREKALFTAEEEEELRGMVDGVLAKLGPEGATLRALGRPLAIDDLKAGNTFGDWAAFACSSFSAWGALTPDGGTITARNFDYLPHAKLEQLAMLIARTPADPARRAFVTVAYPGLLGVISGMNEDGLGLFVHDVMPKSPTAERGIAPRLLVLRRALETLGGDDAPSQVHRLLRDTTTWMGNNIQVTSPFDGRRAPAGIVEYDGVETKEGGAELRLAPDGGSFVLCTNHYRLRKAPERCRRYRTIEEELTRTAAEGRQIDGAAARAIMAKAVQDSLGSKTLHTVVFFPGERRFELMLAGEGRVAPAREPTSWKLSALLPPRAKPR
jgi:hypothetical protein